MRSKWGGKDPQVSILEGLTLIAIGVVFMLGQFGVLPLEFWRTGWPYLVIALGSLQLAVARSPRRVGSGVITVLLGFWFLVAQREMYGLNWWNSWPLAFVAIGTGIVARSITARLMQGKEAGNVDA
jgi:hypothetical protein